MDENEQDPVLLSAEQMEAWLSMLRDAGVQEFEGPHFSVKFYPPAPPAPVYETPKEDRPYKEPASTTMWDNPALWPGGKPPTFPK